MSGWRCGGPKHPDLGAKGAEAEPTVVIPSMGWGRLRGAWPPEAREGHKKPEADGRKTLSPNMATKCGLEQTLPKNIMSACKIRCELVRN